MEYEIVETILNNGNCIFSASKVEKKTPIIPKARLSNGSYVSDSDKYVGRLIEYRTEIKLPENLKTFDEVTEYLKSIEVNKVIKYKINI